MRKVNWDDLLFWDINGYKIIKLWVFGVVITLGMLLLLVIGLIGVSNWGWHW